MKPEQLDIAQLKRELKAERDILKKKAAYSARQIQSPGLSSPCIVPLE
jgi:hypothetical protein